MIVGRDDADHLNEEQIAKAAVETVSRTLPAGLNGGAHAVHGPWVTLL